MRLCIVALLSLAVLFVPIVMLLPSNSIPSSPDPVFAPSIARHMDNLKRSQRLRVTVQNNPSPDFHTANLEAFISSLEKSHSNSEFLNILKAANTQHTCFRDATLPKSLPPGKYLIALNLRNVEIALPHIMLHLLSLLTTVKNKKDVFLSIYESGSDDDTVRHLFSLRSMLVEMGIPHRILAGASTSWASGTVRRDRISFLAAVRNTALEPLWPEQDRQPVKKSLFNMADTLFPPGKAPLAGSSSSSTKSNISTMFQQLADPSIPTIYSELQLPPDGFQADRVIFVNDVFVCAQDIVRLASHDADVACGMDFMYSDRKAMEFWDNWVLRDLSGGGLNWAGKPEFSRHKYTNERISAGLPAPMYSCWNGIIVFKAKPFLNGLRIRAHVDGECASSECKLMLDDFWRLGYRRVLMDPGVRMVYQDRFPPGLLYSRDGQWKIPMTLWEDVVRAGPVVWGEVTRPKYVRCCELKPGMEYVEWENCFDEYDPFAKNHTDTAIKRKFPISMVGARFNSTDLLALLPAGKNTVEALPNSA